MLASYLLLKLISLTETKTVTYCTTTDRHSYTNFCTFKWYDLNVFKQLLSLHLAIIVILPIQYWSSEVKKKGSRQKYHRFEN